MHQTLCNKYLSLLLFQTKDASQTCYKSTWNSQATQPALPPQYFKFWYQIYQQAKSSRPKSPAWLLGANKHVKKLLNWNILSMKRAHHRTSSKWLWIRHIHSYVYNSFRIQRVDIRFDVLVSGVWKGTIYGLRLNMAENENTFVILQSLLTCVCERENHGSTKGKWGIGNG